MATTALPRHCLAAGLRIPTSVHHIPATHHADGGATLDIHAANPFSISPGLGAARSDDAGTAVFPSRWTCVSSGGTGDAAWDLCGAYTATTTAATAEPSSKEHALSWLLFPLSHTFKVWAMVAHWT